MLFMLFGYFYDIYFFIYSSISIKYLLFYWLINFPIVDLPQPLLPNNTILFTFCPFYFILGLFYSTLFNIFAYYSVNYSL